jgi:hypothetical protein
MLAMSDPGSTLRGVGRVIQLEEWRRRRRPAAETDTPAEVPSTADRLEEIVERLDPLVRFGSGKLAKGVETELLAIIGAVHAGRLDEALGRAERLATRLEHPSARAAR